MIIKDISLSNNKDFLTFTIKRPLGDDEVSLEVEMDANEKHIKRILGGTVIAKGEWLDVSEYCEVEELVRNFNSFVEKAQTVSR